MRQERGIGYLRRWHCVHRKASQRVYPCVKQCEHGRYSKASPSSASSRTSAHSYPSAKSEERESRESSCTLSDTCFPSRAAAMVDFPEEGLPNKSTCFEGIDRVEETESRIDDHKSSGGASGVDARVSSILFA